MRSRTIQTWAAGVMLSACAGVLSVFLYFLFLEQPYLTYRNLPFPPQLLTVKPGEVIPLLVIRCNASDKPRTYVTSHALENLDTGQVYILSGFTVPIRPGCTSSVSLSNQLPKEVPPGRYRAFGSAEVRGTIRTFQVDWYSQPFQVVAP